MQSSPRKRGELFICLVVSDALLVGNSSSSDHQCFLVSALKSCHNNYPTILAHLGLAYAQPIVVAPFEQRQTIDKTNGHCLIYHRQGRTFVHAVHEAGWTVSTSKANRPKSWPAHTAINERRRKSSAINFALSCALCISWSIACFSYPRKPSNGCNVQKSVGTRILWCHSEE